MSLINPSMILMSHAEILTIESPVGRDAVIAAPDSGSTPALG